MNREYIIRYSRKSIKFLDNLSKTNNKLALSFIDSFEEIKLNPYDCKKLSGNLKGRRRKRKGEYRIIYEILENNTVKILDIGKRSVVYKKR